MGYVCTRRAAKSYSDELALAKAALERPDVSCLHIGLTREPAERIMWKGVLKAINRRHKLGIRFNESELSARFPNGSVIYLVGALLSFRKASIAIRQALRSI